MSRGVFRNENNKANLCLYVKIQIADLLSPIEIWVDGDKNPMFPPTRPPSNVTRQNPCKTLFQYMHTGRTYYADHQN
jgi:hypothetical protein